MISTEISEKKFCQKYWSINLENHKTKASSASSQKNKKCTEDISLFLRYDSATFLPVFSNLLFAWYSVAEFVQSLICCINSHFSNFSDVIMRVGSRRVGLCVCVSFLLFWYFSSPSSPPPNSYYLNAAHPDSGYLSHVIEITGDLGLYRESSLNSEWSLLWSHTYPFSNKTRLGAQLKELEWGRRVNKIPGGGWLSSKQALAQIKSPFIPRAFTLPAHLEQFLAVRKLQTGG